MGTRLTDIQSPQGFAAESASTAVLLASAHLGFALSTTQVVSGGILGSGVGRRLAQVRWGVAGQMALGWLFTLPVAALVGALAGKLASTGNGGIVLVATRRDRAGVRHRLPRAQGPGQPAQRQRRARVATEV